MLQIGSSSKEPQCSLKRGVNTTSLLQGPVSSLALAGQAVFLA